MELNFEKTFKIFLTTLRLNLLNPNTKRDTKWLISFFLKHCLTTTMFIITMYNIIFFNLRDRDFSQTCKNCTLSVVHITIEFLHCIILWKENYLLELMDKTKNDYMMAKRLPTKEREVIQEYAQRATNMYKKWMIISCIVLGSFIFIHGILMTYFWIMGEFRLIPVYDLVYPDFIDNKKNSIVVYLLIYIALFAYGANACIMSTCFVPLGPSFMLHACGQIEVVIMRIEALFKSDNIEETREKLKHIVKRLQYIYDYVDKINQSFSIAYEVTLKAATVMLPIACYEVVESLKRRELSFEFVSFIVGGATLNSILCYYSDRLQEKGDHLKQAVYSCGWEKVYDREARSTVRIILLRAQRPIAIRTLFSIVCLNTLAALTNQSYTIFNLMNAAWN